jgi:DNA-binding transcriptional LysR family regulator
VPDSFALLCLAELLKQLDRHHPELNVAVTVNNSRVLGLKIEEGTLDLAIMTGPPNTKQYCVEPLGAQAVAWVGNPRLKLSNALHAKDIATQQIITNPAPSPTFSLVMDWFSESGLVPTRLSTCSSVAVIVELVSAEAGISILPTCIIEDHLRAKSLRLLKFSPALPAVEMFAVSPRTMLSRALPEVVKLARKVATETGFVIACTGSGR